MKKGCLNKGCFICIGCFFGLLFLLGIDTVYRNNTAITKKFCRIKIRECYYRIQAFEELYGRLPADLHEIPAGIIPSFPPQSGYAVMRPFTLSTKFMKFVYIPGKNKNANAYMIYLEYPFQYTYPFSSFLVLESDALGQPAYPDVKDYSRRELEEIIKKYQ